MHTAASPSSEVVSQMGLEFSLKSLVGKHLDQELLVAVREMVMEREE